jgi:predicted HTH transcriptional regulator
MRELLNLRRDELLPQTRQLLRQLQDHVKQRARATDTRGDDVRFTQRELRESLLWQDRTLRRHLARLVDLEYVVAYRTGQGNQRAYQLVETQDAMQDMSRDFRDFGLLDADSLRRAPARS